MAIKEFNRVQGIEWKTVLFYAPMCNGREDRMVKTIKSSIGKLIRDTGADWDQDVHQVIYGYCRRHLASGFSPLELMYGVPLRIVQDDGREREQVPSTLSDHRA